MNLITSSSRAGCGGTFNNLHLGLHPLMLWGQFNEPKLWGSIIFPPGVWDQFCFLPRRWDQLFSQTALGINYVFAPATGDHFCFCPGAGDQLFLQPALGSIIFATGLGDQLCSAPAQGINFVFSRRNNCSAPAHGPGTDFDIRKK